MAAIWSSLAAHCRAVRARTSAAALLATRLALETDDSTWLADSPGVTSSYSIVFFRLDARDWDPEILPLSLIVKCPTLNRVTGHHKQQIELHREQTNTVSFSKFIDPRLTYKNRCMAVLTGALRTSGPQR